MKILKGVIFDCDGVLLNSRSSNIMYYNLLRRHFGLSDMSGAEEHYVHMHTAEQSIRKILPSSFLQHLGEALKNIDYMRDLVPFISPEPHITDLLQELSRAGVRLAVHTNRTTHAETVLNRFNLGQYFSMIVTAKSHRPKPDPEGVHAILGKLGIGVENMFFVGDSELDEAAATAAEVDFIAYKNTALKAHFHTSNYKELLAFFLKHTEVAA